LKVVRELKAEGLVTYGGRVGLRLTEAGRRRVEELNQRHKTLEEFFLLIGVAPEEAFREAEKLEHVISPEVVRRIEKLNETLKKMRGVLAGDEGV
jgi:Mn-dependent DtxR family transcriptional regulator